MIFVYIDKSKMLCGFVISFFIGVVNYKYLFNLWSIVFEL